METCSHYGQQTGALLELWLVPLGDERVRGSLWKNDNRKNDLWLSPSRNLPCPPRSVLHYSKLSQIFFFFEVSPGAVRLWFSQKDFSKTHISHVKPSMKHWLILRLLVLWIVFTILIKETHCTGKWEKTSKNLDKFLQSTWPLWEIPVAIKLKPGRSLRDVNMLMRLQMPHIHVLISSQAGKREKIQWSWGKVLCLWLWLVS